MISKQCLTKDWIVGTSKQNGAPDMILVEKSIRAMALLESLVRAGCPLVFKGGTALMLHTGCRRLSIDIDIICPPGTDITQYLEKSKEYGFQKIELIERKGRNNVPKTHSKFFYEVAYQTQSESGFILLDVLYEDIHYSNVIEMPIDSKFVKQDGEPILVNIPSKEDLLGDKLTAFAPQTTGIPYYKGQKSCSMEIIKQMFDVASLFDFVGDLTITSETFKKFAIVELQYRDLPTEDVTIVLDDIYDTSLCICTRGFSGNGNIDELTDGIKRIRSFIIEPYRYDDAIRNASKAAYLSVLLKRQKLEIKKYQGDDLKDCIIQSPFCTKLNKLKKTDPESFFYWYQIYLLISLEDA